MSYLIGAMEIPETRHYYSYVTDEGTKFGEV